VTNRDSALTSVILEVVFDLGGETAPHYRNGKAF
jgi:hypothetical protein